METIIMIEQSKNILYQIELTLLNLKIPKKATFFQKIIAESILDSHMPNKYLEIGFKSYIEDIKRVIKLFIQFIIALIFINLFFSLKEIPLDYILIIFLLFSFYIPFAIPSTYAFDNISNKDIIKIIYILRKNKITNLEKIEYFESYLQKIKSRVNERINAVKWGISAIWILATFLFSQFIAISSNHINKIDLFNFVKIYADIFIFFITPLILTIIVIGCYKRGMTFIFNSIELAIIEIKHQLKNPNEKNLIQSRLTSMI